MVVMIDPDHSLAAAQVACTTSGGASQLAERLQFPSCDPLNLHPLLREAFKGSIMAPAASSTSWSCLACCVGVDVWPRLLVEPMARKPDVCRVSMARCTVREVVYTKLCLVRKLLHFCRSNSPTMYPKMSASRSGLGLKLEWKSLCPDGFEHSCAHALTCKGDLENIQPRKFVSRLFGGFFERFKLTQLLLYLKGSDHQFSDKARQR